MKVCKHCKKDFEGTFCPSCGQRYVEERFKFWESISWFLGSIFNMEKGFWRTTKDLIVKPEKVTIRYLDRITVPYMHPFRYVFIISTFSAFIGVYFNLYEETTAGFNQAFSQDEESVERARMVAKSFKSFWSFILLGMIPLFATATYLLYKSKKRNYAEHLIINSFAQGISILCNLPAICLLFFSNSLITTVSYINLLTGSIVISHVFMKTFKVSAIHAFLKYLLSFVITILLSMVVGAIISIILLISVKLFGIENPFKPA